MFRPSWEETRRELREETNRLLVQRLRILLWLALAGTALFAFADLMKLMPVPILSAYLLYAIQEAVVIVALLSLRRPDVAERVTRLAWLVVVSFHVIIAALGILTDDLVSAPLLFIVLAMATATLFPWGLGPQLATVVVAIAAWLWNFQGVTGGLSGIIDYPTLAMTIALAASIYIARELDRARLAVEQRNIELRGYENVVENANDAILAVDSEYHILGASQGAEVIFGYGRHELIGRPLEVLFPTEESRALRERWENALRGDPVGLILSLEARRKDGQLVPVEIKARHVGKGEGHVASQAIVRDVTTKKVIEQMRSDFVAMLSHDIKTPLAAIHGFVSMLRDQKSVPAEFAALIDRIEANAQLALTLAVNFVDVSRLESGSLQLHRERVSLNDIVRHALYHQESLARGRELVVETALAADVPPLDLDKRLIDRVVANLLSNAIKFSPPHGRIDIETAKDGDQVAFRVRDQGPGIDLGDRDKLFRRYQRVGGERAEGTGLGLFIVKTIVEAHGGKVGVSCPASGGAVFEVSFPAASAA